jgi:hypothetical protein
MAGFISNPATRCRPWKSLLVLFGGLRVPQSAKPKPSWYGESIGHYEGDELVVDTIGVNDKTYVDNYRTPHTDRIHVVERFNLIEGGSKLQSLVTVTDPGAFKMTWSGLQRWRRLTDRPMVENLCAENNADFFGYDAHPIQRPRQISSLDYAEGREIPAMATNERFIANHCRDELHRVSAGRPNAVTDDTSLSFELSASSQLAVTLGGCPLVCLAATVGVPPFPA